MKYNKLVYSIRHMVKKIKENMDFSNVYFFFCFFMITGIIVTITGILISHGTIINHIFFRDTLDTGMDFFHSIEYVKGREPYAKWSTLYPPLANLFFYILYIFIPNEQSSKWASDFESSVMTRGTSQDLRSQQAPMILFLLYVMITVLILYKFVYKFFEKCKYANILSICFIFNLGILWAYERGNVIVISLILSMYFVINRNSPNKVKSEFALVCLALSAGLKIYPALLGILLIYDKKYKKAIRTIIYGVLSFILPCFMFKEGLGCIPLFIRVLTSHTGVQELKFNGFSMDRIMSLLTIIISNTFKIQINEVVLTSVFSKLNIIMCIFLLIIGFFLEKEWQRTLVVCLTMIVYSAQAIYVIAYILLPLLLYIKEEKEIGIDNIVPAIAMTSACMVFPDYGIVFGVVSPMIFRIQVSIVIMIIYVCCLFAYEAKKRMNECKKNRKRSVSYK